MSELAVRRFSPSSLAERIEFARYLAQAEMLPKQYREQPANILLAMEFGDSLGIPMVQAMINVNVIDGKPSANAGLISAMVRRAGHRLRATGDDKHAVCSIWRSDDPEFEFRAEWDIPRAVQAGLCEMTENGIRARDKYGKPMPWEKYTAAMLKARAITECARDAAQDALMGIQYTAEELGGYVDGEGNLVDPPVEPPRRQRNVQAERGDEPAGVVPRPAPEVVDAVPEPPVPAAPEPTVPAPEDLPPAQPPIELPADWWRSLEEAGSGLDLDDVENLGSMAADANDEGAIQAARATWLVVKASLAQQSPLDPDQERAVLALPNAFGDGLR